MKNNSSLQHRLGELSGEEQKLRNLWIHNWKTQLINFECHEWIREAATWIKEVQFWLFLKINSRWENDGVWEFLSAFFWGFYVLRLSLDAIRDEVC